MSPPPSQLGEMLDTSPAARRFYYAHLASLTTRERFSMMVSSSRLVRSLAEASIRREFPDISDPELNVRLAVRLYGRAIVERVLRDVPADAR